MCELPTNEQVVMDESCPCRRYSHSQNYSAKETRKKDTCYNFMISVMYISWRPSRGALGLATTTTLLVTTKRTLRSPKHSYSTMTQPRNSISMHVPEGTNIS